MSLIDYEINYCKVCHRLFCAKKERWISSECKIHRMNEYDNIINVVKFGRKNINTNFLNYYYYESRD